MKVRFSPFTAFALFAAGGFIIYLPVLKAPFFFDDFEFIVNNPLARHAADLFAQWQIAGLKALTLLTFIFNFTVGGQDPFGYHLVNVVLHIFNAGLLYCLTRQILRAPPIAAFFADRQRNFIALVSALIFLVHPVATSAVSYVWQRAELLTALFYLASLIFYVIARLDKKPYYFIFVGIFFVAGLLAKGTIIALPLVLILFECALWPFSRRKAGVIFLSLGLFFLSAYLILWEPWKQRSEDYTLPFIKVTGTFLTAQQIWTQFFVTVKYFCLAVFPFSQNFDYDIGLAQSFWEPRVFSSALILAGLIAGCLLFRNKYRLLTVGIFWFLLCLLPAALMGGRQPMWEYRMYFALAGLILGTVATIFQIFDLRKALAGSMAVVLIFAGLAFSRNLLWQSPERLLLDNIKKSPHKPNPYQLLGAWYLSAGRNDEAQTYLEKTISLAPDTAESYNNLGLIFKNRGQIDRAQQNFETAIHNRPSLSGAYVNLAYLLLNKGEDGKAEEILRQGLEFGETEGIDACLGKVYLSRGMLDEAEGFLKKSLVMNPQAHQAYFWYGELMMVRQDPQHARAMFQKAVALNPRLINLVPKEYR